LEVVSPNLPVSGEVGLLKGVDRLKIGIDIGYGYVKAINDEGQKISFPAMIAPSGNGLGLGDVFKDTVEYQVAIDKSNTWSGTRPNSHFWQPRQ